MSQQAPESHNARWNVEIADFNRDLFGSKEKFTRIGSGEIGGKAKGLLYAREKLLSAAFDLKPN